MGKLTHRNSPLGSTSFAVAASAPREASASSVCDRTLVLAPSALGLRPEQEGHVPGTWKAPEVLSRAGLQMRVAADQVMSLPVPKYQFGAQPGTRIRNGLTIRDFSLALGNVVQQTIEKGKFPIVVGGDCSILLGALYGLRRAGGSGLVHVDGHSDFFHPGNYDASTKLGSAAGMDLALATGRGEALLTEWPGVEGPLVSDADAIQIGDRDALDPAYDSLYGDVVRTGITRLIIQDVLSNGVFPSAQAALARMKTRNLGRAWMHVDLDVLDAKIMPAVDCPGTPGLNFAQLSDLMRNLLASERFAGVTVSIYDPEKDPDGHSANQIVRALGKAFAAVPDAGSGNPAAPAA